MTRMTEEILGYFREGDRISIPFIFFDIEFELMNKDLAKRINEMIREDQKSRKIYERTGVLNTEIDRKNTVELKNIVKKHGWPIISMVGKKASFNAWLIAQHADHDRRFQKKILKLLIAIGEKSNGEINKANIAYLTDRILVAEHRRQVFGTQFQFYGKTKKLKIYPLKNKRGINKLRKEYHLPPLNDFLKSAREYNASRKKTS